MSTKKKLVSRLCARALLLALLLTHAAGALTLTAAQEAERPKDGRYYEALARKAYDEKNYAAFLSNARRAAELRPNHPRLTYFVAAGYALNGDAAGALAWLERVARMGVVMPAETDENFKSLRETAGFKAVVEQFRRNALPVVRSRTAFTVHEKGLVPEGLAYDPVTKNFFVSSIYRRKIVRVSTGGAATDFAPAREGLWSVFGMKVDAARRQLWACAAAHAQMSNFRKEDEGRAALLKFDLRTGRLLQQYELANRPRPHLLGDLVIDARGDVYASDSLTPAVYVVRAGGDRIETFLEGGEFGSPQGLALSADGRRLYLADYGKGIFRIDLKTKETVLLEPPPGSTLLGLDGLYMHRGALVGVQNGVAPARVVRLRLDAAGTRLKSFEIIESANPVFDEPTLAVVVGDELYFIANSQWGAVDEHGQLAPAEKLKDAVVLKLRL